MSLSNEKNWVDDLSINWKPLLVIDNTANNTKILDIISMCFLFENKTVRYSTNSVTQIVYDISIQHQYVLSLKSLTYSKSNINKIALITMII